MNDSLFERLGGALGVANIASDLVDNHLNNPAISARFQNMKMSVDQLKHAAETFISTGTGGPENYQGKDMMSAHKGMNISALEFMAVLDDAMAALTKNGVGQREHEEMLSILYSMRADIILV